MAQINLGTAATGEQVYIDIPTLVSTRLLVTASSGGGKSETLRRILEEAVEHIQCIVIDPEGEFATLREKKPFVLVGEGGEAVADVRTAALVATRLLELNASAVCDLYEMRVQDRHEWVKRFLDAVVHAPKPLWHPVLIVIDEAHMFCPERGFGESVAAQSVIDIANLGRKRSFCPILATQRLSKLNNNAIEPMQNYLVGRTTFDDQKRAASTFKVAGAQAVRDFSLELERLKSGQFIARGRAITGDLLRVQVKRGETRPPVTGSAMAGLVTPMPNAIKALLPRLADLPQEAEKKAKTEEDLRRELAEARRQIAEMQKQKPAEQDSSLVRDLNDQIVGLKQSNRWLTERNEHLEEMRRSLVKVMDSYRADTPMPASPVRSAAKVVPVPAAAPVNRNPASHGVAMPKACRAVLTALAQHSTCTKSRIAALTGYAVNGGGFGNALSECRTKGWLAGSDPMTPTQEGLDALGPVQPLPTGDELLSMWKSKLGKAEREILNALALNGMMTKEELAGATGYAAAGGGFGNALSRLRTLELIEGKGQVALAPDFADALK